MRNQKKATSAEAACQDDDIRLTFPEKLEMNFRFNIDFLHEDGFQTCQFIQMQYATLKSKHPTRMNATFPQNKCYASQRVDQN